MSRNTVLQIIAALITVAVMTGLYFVFDGLLAQVSSDFKTGLLVGMVLVSVFVLIAARIDRSAIGRGRKQQGSRDIIDL